MEDSTYYEIFDISADAAQGDIKTAYRRITTKVHPDQGGSHALFRQVQEAYETLSDPIRRAAYDRSLKEPWRANDGRGADWGDPDDDAGWERVDDTPPSTSNPGSSYGSPDAGPRPWRQPNGPPPPWGPNGRTSGFYPPPPDNRPGPVPGHMSNAEGGAPTFFNRYPSTAVCVAGGVLMFVGSATEPFGGGDFISLGFISILFGLVGLAGSGRHQRREDLRQSGLPPRSPAQRFASELFAGIPVVLGVIAGAIALLSGSNGGSPRRRSGRRTH